MSLAKKCNRFLREIESFGGRPLCGELPGNEFFGLGPGFFLTVSKPCKKD